MLLNMLVLIYWNTQEPFLIFDILIIFKFRKFFPQSSRAVSSNTGIQIS